MRANELDIDYECPACDGTGQPIDNDRRSSCPFCGGDGVYNRVQNAGRPNHVHIGALVYDTDGTVVRAGRVGVMPITDDRGGFDQRYGPETVDDPPQDFQPDMIDRLGNQLGANAPYDLPDDPPYNGASYGREDLTTGSPSDPDLGPNEVLGFLRTRNDTPTADALETTFREIGILDE